MSTHKIHGKLLGFKLKIRPSKTKQYKTATLFSFTSYVPGFHQTNFFSLSLFFKDFLTTSTQLQGSNIP